MKMIRSTLVCMLATFLFAPTAVTSAQYERPQQPKPPAAERNIVELFRLSSVNAEEAVEMLDAMLDSDTAIKADYTTNSVLARGTQQELNQIKEILEKLESSDRVDPAAAGKKQERMRVYDLKYAEANSAGLMLRELTQASELSILLTADPRLNRLFVTGGDRAQELIQLLLENIDVPVQEEESSVVPLTGDSAKDRSLSRLMSGVGKDANVKIEYMPEMNMAVVKGKKESVGKFRDSYQRLMKSVMADQRMAEAQADNFILTASWLTASNDKTIVPPRLESIASRAADFGLENIQMVSQLLARSSVGSDSESQFEVSGSAEADGVRYEIEVAGMLAKAAHSEESVLLNLQLAVEATPSSDGRIASSQAQVQMRLVPGKPAIIASAPVAGKQSLFVIEIVRD